MKTRWKEIIIVVIVLLVISLIANSFATWDVTKPGDADPIYGWPASIRDNWDALEVVFGADLDLTTISFDVNDVNAVDIITKGPWFDVRAKGAKVDGTDASTAIQAAIDVVDAAGGGTVFFPNGTYIIDTALILYDNIRLTGFNATLKLKDSSTHNLIEITDKENITIDHLNFDGNESNLTEGGGTGQHLIYIWTVDNIRISHCNFKNFIWHAIQGLGVRHSRITNNYIKNGDGTLSAGIQLHFNTVPFPTVSPFYNVVADNFINDVVYGIYLSGAHHTIVANNIIINVVDGTDPGEGIRIYEGAEQDGALDNIIIGNIIRGSESYGIRVYSGDAIIHPVRTKIVNNVLYNCAVWSIDNNGSNTTIVGNTMTGTGLGLNIGQYGVNSIVTGNTFDTSGTDLTIHASATGNIIKDNYGLSIPALANNATPSVNSGNLYETGGTTTITDLDDHYEGQIITILCKHSLTFDFTTGQDADHNLDGSSADITVDTGDILVFLSEDGTTLQLISNNDASVDNN